MTALRTRDYTKFVSLAVALAFGALTVTPSLAQEARGTIVGTISDSTGAVIPGAKVEIGRASCRERV